MTAPDKNVVAKPLHERIAEYVDSGRYTSPTPFSHALGLLTEAAAALRNAVCTHGIGMGSACPACAKVAADLHAELSRMRTALEDAEKDAARYRWMRSHEDYDLPIDPGEMDAVIDASMAAAIAERALTAGSGDE